MTDKKQPKKRGLGRGLSALIGDTAEQVAPIDEGAHEGAQISDKMIYLGVDQLQAGRFQPRQNFDDDALATLAVSIAKSGVLQPLLVRPIEGGARYEIIAGERRWRAAQKAKLHQLPVIVQNINDVTALEIGIIENVQRADLNPIEEAEGYQRLIEEFAYTQAELAETIGKSRSHIANLLRLTSAPDAVRRALVEGKISMGHARALLSVKADRVSALVKQIIAEGLSVRTVEKLADDTKAATSDTARTSFAQSKNAAKNVEKDADTRALEKTIATQIGLSVSIDDKGADKGGALRVEYKSLEQLDGLVARLMRH